MKIIKDICESIRNSLDDAEKYASLAVKCKETDTKLTEIYSGIAQEHLNAIDKLHERAVEYIKQAKESGKEVPAPMQAVWDWEHEKMVSNTVRVKELLAMAKR